MRDPDLAQLHEGAVTWAKGEPVVVLLDPTMLMSGRTAQWVKRHVHQAPSSVAMVEALASTSGLNGVDAALGVFAGPRIWAYRRWVQCAVPVHYVHDHWLASELFTVGPQTDGRGLRQEFARDAVIAAQMLTAMREHDAWVLARRPPLFDLLVAAGLTVVARTRRDGTTDGDALWAAAFAGDTGEHIAALSRRTRYLAHALDPVTSDAVLSALAPEYPHRSITSGFDYLPVIEVLDAGPPGKHWR